MHTDDVVVLVGGCMHITDSIVAATSWSNRNRVDAFTISRNTPAMTWFQQTRIETSGYAASSLCWRGDELVDWVRGGDYWTADGTAHSASRGWGYGRFDTVAADRTGRWAVVHERTGTAGLLIHDGEIVREIHRSPYHADVFLYPACLFMRAGRVLLAHCPDSYARIEIEDAETGERLTRNPERKEADFFHSRLAASPGGKWLVSAGWIWQPWDVVIWFDVGAALADPTSLDVIDSAPQRRDLFATEETSAVWLDDDRIVIDGGSIPDDPEEPGPSRPAGLATYDLAAEAYVQNVELGYPAGTMMRVGTQHVVTFFGKPRLVSLAARKIVHEWELESGETVSSIVRDRPIPALALDPERTRFAVAGKDGIDVVAIDLAALESK